MPSSVLPPSELIGRALRADRPGLRRLRRRIERARKEGRPHDRNLARLRRELAASVRRRRGRARSRPAVRYPADLPVVARRDEILEVLRDHQVVIVCGETGSGKSTQLPKMLLELGLGADGPIGHTQPRRVAARSLARRIAEELATPLGEGVGFKVRFADETGVRCLVKLMTDGVLLAETRGDPLLQRYDAIILDEAHERSLNIDFLLGYLRRLLPRRPDLKVVVTSATIDAERFARHMGAEGRPAPVVEVSGRTHPVEVRWHPPDAGATDGDVDLASVVADEVGDLLATEEGDGLVFLPTQRDIAETARVLRGRRLPGCPEILPLFARLSLERQQRVFQAGRRRRVVLATNVAESSVTVPAIRWVVDTGTARVSRYAPRSRIQRLPIEPVSKASADQRKGRCGRVGPGVCVRLYDEDDHASREAYTTPEIQRSHLAAVLLQMIDLRLGPVEAFPFMDPPRRAAVHDARRTLVELGAVDGDGHLTEVGRTLARLPVDPRVGRMILAGHEEGCLAEMLVVAAALETADPRERPPGREKEADRAHAAFRHDESDVLGLLRLWDAVQELAAGRSRRRFAAACRERMLSPSRVRDWTDVHRQLRRLVAESGMAAGARRDDADAVHRALLAGLLPHVACRTGKYEYTGTDGKPLSLWPGSALFHRRPRWIVAAEVVETRRRYARMVGRIDPRWIEDLAPDLVEHHVGEPAWDAATGHVMARERVTFRGLTIVPRRRVSYERFDPVRARELFLRHGLAEGDVTIGAPFLEHNVSLVNDLAALEAKTRRRGLLDREARYDFYDRRVPAEVASAPAFQRWRRRAERSDPDLLFMSRGDLLQEAASAGPDAYPDSLDLGGVTAPLRYRFAPGEEDDGVTAVVPLARLGLVDRDRAEWIVPGLLRERVVALMRTLPKELRRRLVPIPAHAADVLAELDPSHGSLRAALTAACQRVAGVPVSARDLRPERLPDHLHLRLLVVDDDGRAVAAGRDLTALRRGLGRRAERAVAAGEGRWHRDGLVSWDFGRLPSSVRLEGGGVGWPALVDAGGSVSLRLRGRQETAEHETRGGLVRLVALAMGSKIAARIRRWRGWPELSLGDTALGRDAELLPQLVDRVAERAWVDGIGPVRDEAAFRDVLEAGTSRLLLVLDELMPLVAEIVSTARDVRRALDEARARPWDEVLVRVEAHVEDLLGGRPFAEVPWPWLRHLPRYLRATARRLERVATRGTLRDADLERAITPHARALASLTERARRQGGPGLATLERYRWWLEELRVSVFAQELGTAVKVSDKRLAAVRAEVERELDAAA